MTQTAFTIERCDSAPAPTVIEPLLTEYYTGILASFEQMGVDTGLTPADPISDFWDHIDAFLPPAGVLCIARDQSGQPVGCGSLARLDDTRGELKRLFVKPRMRGTGLGRALVQTRIDAARAMGLRTLLVDTMTSTHAMQALYARLGFTPRDRYAESSTANAFPHLRPHMLYFERHL